MNRPDSTDLLEPLHPPAGLAEQVAALLEACRSDEQRLAREVGELAGRRGQVIYQVLLEELVGLRFPAAEAADHWRRARELRPPGCASDCALYGVRTRLLNYLYRVTGDLKDPRILDAEHLARYRYASVTDGLTGLYHQACFKGHLQKLLESSAPVDRRGFALIMFDLDHFKQYNDRCGHLAGDQALKEVAGILQSCIRQGDLAARYGGEEFALLLHRLNKPQAAMVAERVRSAVERHPFAGEELLSRGVLTISGGLAFYPEDGDSLHALIDTADQRLYRAKQRRNTIFPLNQDQRRLPRTPVHSVVEYCLDRNGPSLTGLSQDLSEVGITLSCPAAPDLGHQVRLSFRSPFWPMDCSITGTVRNVQQAAGEGLARVGLQFEPSARKAARGLLRS